MTPHPHRFTLLRRQEGVSLVIMLGVMLITSLLVIAAFTSANGEVHLTNTDRAQKKAYYAAEAGLEDYENQLTQDSNYLSYCTSPTPANPALNQEYEEGTETPIPTSKLKTAEVPEVEVAGKLQPSEEKYAIQLLPASSDKETPKKCNPNNLVESMVEEKGAATGTFRIESTGFSGNEKRSLVATFKNANFVSYVWYTKYETFDPVIYGGNPTLAGCSNFYTKRAAGCENNYFIEGETINGPMHTEDHVGICGKPVFGRNATDRIEFGQFKTETTEPAGYSTEGDNSCGGSHPEFVGTHILPSAVKELQPPPGDEELEHIVEQAPTDYKYQGKTELILEGNTMTVRDEYKENPTTKKIEYNEKTGVPFPPNGVIYVSGSCAAEPYSPDGPTPKYSAGDACGDVYVHSNGNYTSSLTIGAQEDVIINGNLTTPVGAPYTNGMGTPTSNAMVGLIANNFVRIYHPCSGGVNGSGSLEEPIIYAAILALNHAFMVDNYNCGAPFPKKLNIYGAIAGLFSNGLTGVFENTSDFLHGYPFNLNYDNRLQVEEPPHFLNPIQADWYIQRQTLASSP